MYKEDLLKKISSYKNRIDNVTHLEPNLKSHIFSVSVPF